MKLKISYKVGSMAFSAIVNNIAEAYEYIKFIVDKEEINFPKKNEALSKYMVIIAKFKYKGAMLYENDIFEIKRMDEEDK